MRYERASTRRGEPNGDYQAGCWLSYGGSNPATFNDLNCNYQTGGTNVYSTNDKGAPSSEATFTSCGQSGPTGPSQGQCDTAYAGTSLDRAGTVDSGCQLWTVPATGDYRITASGAGSRKAASAVVFWLGVNVVAVPRRIAKRTPPC